MELPVADAPRGLEQVVGREPSLEFALAMAEEYERLRVPLLACKQCGSQGAHSTASGEAVAHRLEGYTNGEIAEQIGSTPEANIGWHAL